MMGYYMYIHGASNQPYIWRGVNKSYSSLNEGIPAPRNVDERYTHPKLDTLCGKDGDSTKSHESARTSKHNDWFFILKMSSHLWPVQPFLAQFSMIRISNPRPCLKTCCVNSRSGTVPFDHLYCNVSWLSDECLWVANLCFRRARIGPLPGAQLGTYSISFNV